MSEGGKNKPVIMVTNPSKDTFFRGQFFNDNQEKIKELQGLSERWARIKAGDPERFNSYHGCEARGI